MAEEIEIITNFLTVYAPILLQICIILILMQLKTRIERFNRDYLEHKVLEAERQPEQIYPIKSKCSHAQASKNKRNEWECIECGVVVK